METLSVATNPQQLNSKKKKGFVALYCAVVLLSLHWAMVLYVNSSFLEQYVSNAAIGLLYTVSGAFTILSFLFISRVLHRAGNYHLTVALATIELLVLLGMAFAETERTAIPLFLIHQAIVPLILFNLDIFMEQMIGSEEGSTGSRRGLFLTMMGVATAIAPLASGYLVGENGTEFAFAYIAGALLMLPFICLIIFHFRNFADPQYAQIKVLSTLRSFWTKKNVRNVFFAHFLLQLFFAWMVVYTPLYLYSVIGLGWNEIGLVLFAGLMAYVFLEYPVGLLADKWIGEKEIMALGFLIIAVSTSWFIFMDTDSVGVWMFIMFLTRVGASMVEVTTESYFFKKTSATDSSVISFFRITRPLSYVIGALLGSLTLLYLSFNLLFLVLGLMMIPGFFFTMALHDTK